MILCSNISLEWDMGMRLYETSLWNGSWSYFVSGDQAEPVIWSLASSTLTFTCTSSKLKPREKIEHAMIECTPCVHSRVFAIKFNVAILLPCNIINC